MNIYVRCTGIVRALYKGHKPKGKVYFEMSVFFFTEHQHISRCLRKSFISARHFTLQMPLNSLPKFTARFLIRIIVSPLNTIQVVLA
jgi:hypothetical protein